jgi:hypothetical protein
LIEEYIDTERRVIRLDLEPLPQDPVERALQLQTNDETIFNLVSKTPTPFYAIIYTSTTGEPFGTGPEHKGAKYLDMFADIVRKKRDPRNRQGWKNQQEREIRLPDPERTVSRLPPHKQFVQELEQKKKKEEGERGRDNLNAQRRSLAFDISNETLLSILVANVTILVVWLGVKFLRWSSSYGKLKPLRRQPVDNK